MIVIHRSLPTSPAIATKGPAPDVFPLAAPSPGGTFAARAGCFAERREILKDEPKKGDEVTWKSHGGRAEGKVVKKVTKAMDIKGHHVAASPKNPEYLVETAEGKRAAHEAGALKRKEPR